MYTFIREVTFKTMADAVRAAPMTAAISKYYKDKHKIDMRLMRPISGLPTRLRFIFETDSLDAWQSISEKAIKDPTFHKLLGEIGPTVDGSKTHDEIWH